MNEGSNASHRPGRHSLARFHRSAARGRAKVMAGLLALALVLSGAATLPGSADPGDTANARAQFIGGSLLSAVDLSTVLGVGGVEAGYPSDGGVPQYAPLDVTALSSLNVTIPGGVSLPLGNFLSVGAVNQYAVADTGGVSRAVSGAVSDSGIVSLSGSPTFPANANINLVTLLGPAATGILSTGRVELGAITGVASQNAATPGALATNCADVTNPVHCRGYNVANAQIVVQSPLVAGIVGNVNTAVGTLSTTIDSLGGSIINGVTGALSSLGSLLSALGISVLGNDLQVTITSNLSAAVAPLLATQLTDGVVTIDLSNGVITADLAGLIGGLSNRPPGTELISPAVLADLSSRVGTLLTGLQTSLNTVLTAAVNSSTVELSGGICVLEVAGNCTVELDIGFNTTIAGLIAGTETITVTAVGSGVAGTILAGTINATSSLLITPLIAAIKLALGGANGIVGTLVTTALGTLGANLGTIIGAVLTPLTGVFTLLGGILGVTLNNQEDAGAAKRETALRITVGDLLGSNGIAQVNLGMAEVGPNVLLAAPTLSLLTPPSGPLAGGNIVTITGTDFAPGISTVVFDGATITPSTITGTTITFPAPPRNTPATVPVTVSNGAGLVGNDLPYQYLPPTLAAADTVYGSPVAVTGAGWPTGTAITLTPVSGAVPIGPPLVVPAAAVAADGSFTASVPLNPGTGLGAYSMQAEDVPGNTVADPFAVIAGNPAAATLTPNQGPLAGGTEITVTGTGFVPGTSTVTFDGVPVSPTAVTGTTIVFDALPGENPGPVAVVVSNGTGTDSALPYLFLPPSVLASSPATVGDPVLVDGAGWPLGTDVTLTPVDGTDTPVGPAVLVPAVDLLPDGSFDDVPLTLNPGLPAVTYTVQAVDEFINTAEDDFLLVAGQPTAATLTPDSGPLAGGGAAQITGTGFVPGTTTVTFDGVLVPLTGITGSTLDFLVPPGEVSGPVPVVVSNGPALFTAPLTYSYDPPTVTATGPVVYGDPVTVAGAGWPIGVDVELTVTTAGAATVGELVVPAANVDPTGAFSVSVPLTAAALPGTLTVTAVDENSNTADDTFLVVAGTPTAASLAPDHGPLAGGTAVTVTGTGFVPGTSVVIFDGTSITPTSVTATSLEFTVPGADLPGGVIVQVSNGAALISGDLGYTYDAPTITAFSPVVYGSPVSVVGVGWPLGVDVEITVTTAGNVPVGQVTVPAGAISPAGGFNVLVPLSAAALPGQLTATAVDDNTNTATSLFTVIAGAPVAASLNPTAGPLAGGDTVTISGSGFVPGTSVVIFDGVTLTPTGVTPTAITFVVPPGSLAGPVDVQVSNGTGTDSAELTYTYQPPSVSAAPTVAYGDPVAVTGAGWPLNTAITLTPVDGGGDPVGDPVTVPAAAVGATGGFTASVPLYPTTVVGSYQLLAADVPGNTAQDDFAVVAGNPSSVSLSPDSGPLVGGTVVTVTGDDFVPGTSVVIFDGQPVTPDSVTLTSIVFTVPPGSVAGPVPVVISNGTATDSAPLPFTFLPPAVQAADAIYGDPVAVTGTGWPTGVDITLVPLGPGATPVGPPVTVPAAAVSATGSFTVSVPLNPGTPLGTYTLNALDENGNTDDDTFAVVGGVPSAVDLDPDQGPLAGGNNAEITGTGFIPGVSTVSVAGVPLPAAALTSVTSTTITFVMPGRATTGTVNVQVSNGPGLVSQALPYLYLPPTVTAADPIYGNPVPVNGSGWPTGVAITLTPVDAGSNPVGAPVVVPAAAVSATGIFTASVPLNPGTPLGTYTLQAVDQNGNTAADAFQVVAGTPTAASLAPVSGSLAGGNPVTLTGSGFVPGTSVVVFDGITVTPTSVTPTQIVFPVPAGENPGLVTVVVVNGPGLVSSPLNYTYLPPQLAADPEVIYGNPVPVNGSGWPTGTDIVLTPYNGANPIGAPVTVPAAAVSAAGGFATTVPLAAGTPLGNYTVAAVDEFGNSVTDTFAVVAADPTAATLTPTSGPLVGGNPAQVVGTGFVPGVTELLVDGDVVTPTTVTGSTIDFVVPAGTVAGPVQVVVSNGPTLLSDPLAYTYLPPTVSAADPFYGAPVQVTGAGWPSGVDVVLTPINASNTPVGAPVTVPAAAISATGSFTANVPLNVGTPLGNYTLRAVDTNTNTASDTFTVLADTPVLADLSPDSGRLAGGEPGTITGSGFVPGVSVVLVDGTPVTPATVTPVQITFVLPGADNPGPVNVLVSNGTGLDSGPLPYTYLPPAVTAADTVYGSPVSVTGTGWPTGVAITLTPVDAGSNPVGAPVVVPAGSVSATGSFTATVPLAPGTGLGSYQLNALDGNGNPATDAFAVIAGTPTAATLLPVQGLLAGGNIATVTGSGFVPGTSLVIFDGAPVTPDTATPTQLTFEVPPGDIAGLVSVLVFNGPGLISGPLDYTYLPPVLDAQSPVLYGDPVPVTGTGWPLGVDVTLSPVDSGGDPAGPDLVVPAAGLAADGSFTMLLPLTAGTPVGTYTALAEDTNTNTAEDDFAVIAGAPTAASLDPDQGPLVGGTDVVIDGSGFVPGVSVVIFDGVELQPDTVTPTEIGFAVPPGTLAGPVDVVVSNGETYDSDPLTYTYAAPTISASTPEVYLTTVQITGAGWPLGVDVVLTTTVAPDGPATLAVGDQVGTEFTVPAADLDADGGFSVSVPLDVAAVVDDYLMTGEDEYGNVASDTFAVIAGDPSAAALDPDHGPLIGGTEVTITGTGFVPGTSVVIFDGVPVTPVSVTGTEIVFVVPPGTVPGAVPVLVDNGTPTDSDPLDFVFDPPTVDAASPVVFGAPVPATGAGWPADSTVTLTPVDADGDPVGPDTVVPPGQVSDAGGFQVPVPLNSGTGPGSYLLLAVDELGTTAQDTFQVVAGQPTADTLTPDNGPLPGGTEVVIDGGGFVPGVTVVVIDGEPVTPVSTTPTTVVIVMPPGSTAGPTDVEVTNEPGLNSDPLPYTYLPPTIDAGSPVTLGDPVPLTGTGWPAGVDVTVTPVDAAGEPIGDPVVVPAADIDIDGAWAVDVSLYGTAVVGDQLMLAQDENGNTAADSFRLQAAAVDTTDPDTSGPTSTSPTVPPTTPPTVNLPATGVQGMTEMLWLAALALLLGLAAISYGALRRPRSAGRHQ